MTETDTITYANANGDIVFELEGLPEETYGESLTGESYLLEFSLTINVSDTSENMYLDLSREDMEILQRVVNDALSDKV